MPDSRFAVPKSNEYQWRNLYLKEHGICTYAPPMPRNPETTGTRTTSTQQRHANIHRGMRGGPSRTISTTTADAAAAAAAGTSNTATGTQDDVEDDNLFDMTARRSSMLRRTGMRGTRLIQQRVSLDVRRRSSGFDYLEELTDQQLFSENMFSFLSRRNSDIASSLGMSMSQELPGVKTPSGPATHSSVEWGNVVEASAGNRKNLTDAATCGETFDELQRLQRETWQLLMDNRIMLWFEREAKQRGRIAASVQWRLLEVVTGTPETQRLAKSRRMIPDAKSRPLRQEAVDVAEPAKTATATTSETAVETGTKEDEHLMEVLQQFAPFFAVISSPDALQRLMGVNVLARQRGRRGGAPELVGLPLFSQYATWRETYENRKAWRLAPFSFFLIHDSCFNHAHISALYVLLDLIRSSAHTHSIECTRSDRERQWATALRQRRTRGGKDDMTESVQCPLAAIQELTEDLLIAYEQSTSRTTLSMAVYVQDFLTDVVLDPDTSSCFLSSTALQRQCGYDLCDANANSPFGVQPKPNEFSGKRTSNNSSMSMNTTNVNADNNSTAERSSGGDGSDILKSEQPDVSKVDTPMEPGNDGDQVDWNTLKQLNDTAFDELFTLAQWFVDTPSSNSLLPVEQTPSWRPSSRSNKSTVLPSMHSSVSITQESKKSITGVISEESALTPAKPKTQVVGRAQEYDATLSLVEAITRYELQRQQVLDMRLQEQRQRTSAGQVQKKQRKKRFAGHRALVSNEVGSTVDLPLGATLLTTPLIFITGYIRLHGAPWLKELLGRMFNILRRESVLLYVNGLEMQLQPHASPIESVSHLSGSFGRGSDPLPSFGRDLTRWNHLSDKESAYFHRMERLEDLICQDIQYVMEEFFSALHGQRSMTRLPQGISTILTSFCTTIHLHLLRQHVAIDGMNDKPAIRVRKTINGMRQKRVTAGAGTSGSGHHHQDPTDRLIRSIESHRLAKFILFDCWIIPALNNAVKFGYLPASSSNHLCWNVDAFARYLKILVNSVFVPQEEPDLYIHTTTVPMDLSPQMNAIPSIDKKSRGHGDSILPPSRCNTVKLPPLINGIYDVATGTLMQLFRDPGGDGELDMRERFVFGDSPSLSGTLHSKGGDTGSGTNADASRTWYDLSGALSTLNEWLGITGGYTDGEETYEDDTDITPARILNIFCARASGDISAKVVVSEYEVEPSVAASCISKCYSLMSGEHPLVRNACLSGALIGYFKSSPYLTCLTGVLLHPRMASRVLENISQNSSAFYNVLMKPLQDESLLALVSSLVAARKHLPLVDSNELLSLIASVPVNSHGKSVSGAVDKMEEQKEHRSTQVAMWDATTRRLLRQLAQSTTGSALDPEITLHPQLRRYAPTNSYPKLRKTADLIEREMERVPLCFDTWWRAMVVALTVKAMNVIEECSETRSSQWQQWCRTKMHEVQREYHEVCAHFIQRRGSRTDIPKTSAGSFSKTRKSGTNSLTLPSVTQSLSFQASDRQKPRKRVAGRKGLKSEKKKGTS